MALALAEALGLGRRLEEVDHVALAPESLQVAHVSVLALRTTVGGAADAVGAAGGVVAAVIEVDAGLRDGHE